MKKVNKRPIKLTVVNAISWALLFLPFTGFTQKIPEVQRKGQRAPLNIKVDGRILEWNNTFQAYNHATDIFYTMANNDQNLYLVIRTNNEDELVKITSRGIVLNINKTGRKNDQGAISITYPVFEMGHKPYIHFPGIIAMPKYQRDAMERNKDSTSNVANKKLHDNERYIRTNGIAGVDTLLSIYNRDGIKAAEAFDSTMTYTYEIAVPLKLLGLTINNSATFAYHIIFPGMDLLGDTGATMKNGTISMRGAAMPKKEHFNAVSSTTDFWGEYTLIR